MSWRRVLLPFFPTIASVGFLFFLDLSLMPRSSFLLPPSPSSPPRRSRVPTSSRKPTNQHAKHPSQPPQQAGQESQQASLPTNSRSQQVNMPISSTSPPPQQANRESQQASMPTSSRSRQINMPAILANLLNKPTKKANKPAWQQAHAAYKATCQPA